MPNWKSSMQQTFEFYIVDPDTWKDVKLLDTVKSCTINRDSEAETLGSATIDIIESVGECYIRVYLITIQNGIKEKHPLGTFLVQTPASSFNGKIRNVSMDAYTPLLELKEKLPPIGYFIHERENILKWAVDLTKENLRAPVVSSTCDRVILNNFVADSNDTWLGYLTSLLAKAKYKYDLDEMSRIIFAPEQEIDALQPVWTYDDGNSSILYPEINMDHDLYGIPNVVEVVFSNENGSRSYVAENHDSNSPTSIENRGRRIIHRVTDPDIHDISEEAPEGNIPTEQMMETFAEELLKKLSTVEYTVSYTHGYCPVRVGDCVRLNYERAGLTNIKAKVISQSIKCTPGCPVSEKAVFTTKLWG